MIRLPQQSMTMMMATMIVAATAPAALIADRDVGRDAALAAPTAAAARRSTADIAELIEAAEAGATVVVPPGIYHGQLRILKSITLEGRGRVTIDGGGEGTVVEIRRPDVTFRGFTVRASGEDVVGEPAAIRATTGPVVIENNRVEDALFGIDISEAAGSVIRDNIVRGKDLEPGRRGDGIRLWWSHDTAIVGNEVYGSRDMVFWYSDSLDVRDNRVTDSRYGLHFMYSHDTVLRNNVLSENSVGVYLMYSHRIHLVDNRMTANRGASGYGLGLKDCDDITIDRNALLANRVGIYIDNSPSSIGSWGRFESNLLAFNETGLLATPNTHDNIVVGNAFIDNEEQVAVHGRGTLDSNLFTHQGAGNFWSDYAGFDLDGDERGDIAHAPRSLFHSLLAAEPNLRIFLHSPAQRAVDFTARALPEFQPPPTLTDTAPLTRMPTTGPAIAAGVEIAPTRHWAMLGVGASLLLGVAGICRGATREGAKVMNAAMRGQPDPQVRPSAPARPHRAMAQLYVGGRP